MSTQETFIILDRIKSLAEDISAILIPFMRDVQNDQSVLVEEISTITGFDIEKSKECISNLLIEASDDVSRVKNELERFKQSLESGDELVEDSFLSKVWHGDVYDVSYDEGLKKLEEELKENLEKSDEESIVQSCINSLTN